MSLMIWKIIAKKRGTNYIELIEMWGNNIKDVKRQLKKDKYKFIADITQLEELK